MSFFVEQNPFVFLVLTVILGGAAAFMAGRSVALGWKSPLLLAGYMLLFTAGVRFMHFALYEAQLTSLHYYISHGLVIMAFAFFGYRLTLTQQMVAKYPWLYERSGLLSWRPKT